MKKEGYNNKSVSELRGALTEKRSLLMQFRFKIGKGKAKDNKEGMKLKKEIARILTAMKIKSGENVSQ
jgi:ribosomal protein L29